jgi:predicted ATP-dependent serine protease
MGIPQQRPIPTVICPTCNLRTPAWRSKCIHCQKPWNTEEARVANIKRTFRIGGGSPLRRV